MGRMIIYDDDRFSTVPWLSTEVDLRAQGPPESYIDDAFAGVHIDSLHIVMPFGKGSDAVLSIKAVRGDGNDGGTISLAIGAIRYFVEPIAVPAQSNPRRALDQQEGDCA